MHTPARYRIPSRARRGARLAYIEWRHERVVQKETLWLARNPALRADLHAIAERLGRRMQSGFALPKITA